MANRRSQSHLAWVARAFGSSRAPASVGARLMPLFIRTLGMHRAFTTADATIAQAQEHQIRPEPYAPPKKLHRNVDVSVRHLGAWPVYTVTPRTGAITRRALFTHGGAWVYEISPFHWNLVAELAASTGTEVTVPIYPLAPRGTASAVVPVIADLADELVADVGADNVSLIGDSAGGNITLAAAMLSRERGLQSPARLVLISPVLDLSFDDPRISEIEPDDPWLSAAGTRAAGNMWRGTLPVTDPLVSPGFGTLSGLGRITLFSGTRDITNADAHRLVEMAEAEQHPLDFHEGPGMIHVYPLLPIREGAQARRTIARTLMGTP